MEVLRMNDYPSSVVQSIYYFFDMVYRYMCEAQNRSCDEYKLYMFVSIFIIVMLVLLICFIAVSIIVIRDNIKKTSKDISRIANALERFTNRPVTIQQYINPEEYLNQRYAGMTEEEKNAAIKDDLANWKI
jgi:uncharacterized membrane protein